MMMAVLGLILSGVASAASAEEVAAARPELAAHIRSLQPIKNRAGKYFFPGDALVEPEAQVLIADRLLEGRDDLAVRVALAYALTGDNRLPWRVIQAQEAPVRAALLAGYKRKGTADAVEALAGGLSDEAQEVRFEALRLLGRRPELTSPALTAGLMASLKDPSADLRSAAVRALSWRKASGSFDAIVPSLRDADAKVRGAAVRALGILDTQRAHGLEALMALRDDPNPHVQRAFRSLRAD